ncbi:hypothetical protein OKW21_000621 [Catalinimonas alkaloidigena]|uniref:DUF6678 family protein n=1 Tax=Catalinimonas alkaloidigena TaxID=1075417 RepID=UPI002406C5D8|nr:DUF6678 family protein [Catalinimonas alkaloidigena]MDF9795358.1 hypothetical protein [Catalinimonas alkaloidigena]
MKKTDFLTKLIFSRQLVSVMNRTKWKELADEMTSNQDFNPKVRIKYLEDELPLGFSHLDWEWVKFGDSRVIEWMEIDSVKREYVGRLIDDKEKDYSEWIRKRLKANSIPFDESDGIFRILGYLSPTKE